MLNNLRLPWKTEFALKFFTVLKYFISFWIFGQLELALKTEFALIFSSRGAANPPPRTPLPTDTGEKTQRIQQACVNRWLFVQQTDAKLYWHHCSFHFKWKTIQCYAGLQTIQRPSHTWKHRNNSLKKQSTILKLPTHSFSALLDESSSLIGVVWLIKDLKRWLFIYCNKHLKNILLFDNEYLKVFVAVTYLTGMWGKLPLHGNLKVTTEPHLAYISVLVLFWLSVSCHFLRFSASFRDAYWSLATTFIPNTSGKIVTWKKFKGVVIAWRWTNAFEPLTSDQFVWRKLRPLHHPLLCKN